MGIKFKFSFILVTCALQRKDEEALTSCHLYQRYRAPPTLRTLHHCLVEKVMYHFRAIFK